MGIAWFDDSPPPPEAPDLRTGGLPLMAPHLPWPTCPRCELPMLFRAQLPLALLPVGAFDDDRLILVFECHARVDHSPCREGMVVVVRGPMAPRKPPKPSHWDVTLRALGATPQAVRRLARAARDGEPGSTRALRLPATLLWSAPRFLAMQTARSLGEAGAEVSLRPSPPMVLANPHGGRLVPFEEELPGSRRTTLPPLRALLRGGGPTRLRGLLGGSAPDVPDSASLCGCGRRRRVAVTLFRASESVELDPATVFVCLRCNEGSLVRRPARLPMIGFVRRSIPA